MLTKDQQPTTYLKSQKGASKMNNKNNLKAVLMLFGFLIFVGGAVSVFLISQNQNTTPVAPNVPQSKPAAFIEKLETCTLVFDVTEPDKLACGAEGCVTNSDCSGTDICIEAEDGNKYCAKEAYEEACAADPSVESCCSAPPGPELLTCGEKGCSNTDDCEEGFVCISTAETDTAGNIVKYCADDRYLDACVDEPNAENCCEAPPTITTTVTVTVTPTDEPTVTPTGTVTTTGTITPTGTVTPTGTKTVTPSVTTVITTVGCNDVCQANADCANISHICYNGQCRLDVNPTDAQCKLPSGETTIVRPVVVPTESGPADWINYVKAGLGALGIGALLLLLL